jgi:hypothetical protein
MKVKYSYLLQQFENSEELLQEPKDFFAPFELGITPYIFRLQ